MSTQQDNKMSIPSGFDALGKPVPAKRLSEALEHLRHMYPDMNAGEAMLVIGRMAGHIERDRPYEAQQEVMNTLNDLTAYYRLMAVMLASPVAEENSHE